MLCLDTNIVIGIINRRRIDWRTRMKAEVEIGSRLIIPVCVVYELLYGAAKSERSGRNYARVGEFLASDVAVAPFTEQDAAEAGLIRADLERRGTPIGPIDVLIAAQARVRGAVLVTDNLREFRRVQGLAVADWS